MDKPDMYTIAMMPGKGKFREINAPVHMRYYPKKKVGKSGPLRQLFDRVEKLASVVPVER